jgi:hypothetical protein
MAFKIVPYHKFVMKLKLLPCKKTTRSKRQIQFAVVDMDKADRYPRNYVVMLPRNIFDTNSPFSEAFGERRRTIAKQLLFDALKETRDSLVKAEIERRLKQI